MNIDFRDLTVCYTNLIWRVLMWCCLVLLRIKCPFLEVKEPFHFIFNVVVFFCITSMIVSVQCHWGHLMLYLCLFRFGNTKYIQKCMNKRSSIVCCWITTLYLHCTKRQPLSCVVLCIHTVGWILTAVNKWMTNSIFLRSMANTEFNQGRLQS